MASRTMSLGTHEIDFLKETLQGQQELLQKLYNELDVERESSGIAADEALSMILRLQGEKAAMEMEASQYKRIAEEKMCHAQETLEIFQELIYQKEMQIASLEFQVQAYRFKLLSMGCEDLGVGDVQYPENMLSRRNGVPGEASGQSSVRRGSSVPPPLFDALSRRASAEGAKSSQSSPRKPKELKDAEPSSRRDNPAGDVSYWEEIRKLDERVKELANITGFDGTLTPNIANGISESDSLNPSTSTTSMRDPSPDNFPVKSDCSEYPEKGLSVQACGDSPCTPSVQDIFEVPPCSDNDHHQDSTHKKEKCKLSLEDDSRHRKLDSVWDEIWKSDVKENIDWEKKPLLSAGTKNDFPELREVKEKSTWGQKPLPSPGTKNDFPELREVKEKSTWGQKPLLSPGSNNDLPKSKDGKSAERQMLYKQPTYGVADFELQQFNRRLKQLEDERFVARGREVNDETGDEGMRLLREIVEKVDSMQADIASWRNKKPPRQEDHSVGCLKEAMLCFLP